MTNARLLEADFDDYSDLECLSVEIELKLRTLPKGPAGERGCARRILSDMFVSEIDALELSI